MPVIRLAFIITVCPMIIKHLFFMDVVCFVIGLNPGSSKSTWESKKKKKKKSTDIHSLSKTICQTWKMHCNLHENSLYFSVILVSIFLLFLSHFSKCVCVTLEAHQCLRSWVCNELMEKRPTVCWEKEAFLPGTLFILCLCGNITDFVLSLCICSILATNRYFAH